MTETEAKTLIDAHQRLMERGRAVVRALVPDAPSDDVHLDLSDAHTPGATFHAWWTASAYGWLHAYHMDIPCAYLWMSDDDIRSVPDRPRVY